MLIKLILIFSLVPLLELMFLIKLGSLVGIWTTIFLVAGTGIVGVSIARKQGLALIAEIKAKFARGEMPKNKLLDGGLLLLGAAMLLTPGLLTDTLGFLLILPFTRPVMRKIVKDRILLKHFDFNQSNNQSYQDYDDNDEVIDITDYEEIDDE